MNPIDILGYSASLMILISMLMKDMYKFRIVNTLACLLFTTYGIIKMDNPVIVLNATVVVINVIYLIKNRKK